MSQIFLCGQTGVINRGCEAIVRSTVKVIGGRTGDISVATFAPQQDRKMCRELGVNMISYNNYPTPVHRYISAGLRKLNKKSVAGQGLIQKPLFSHIQKGDICLNIGGDTYCYGRPTPSIALNKFTEKHNIDNILWCCSIEKDNIKGEILEDLNRYSYIFAREPLTFNALIDAGINEKKVIKCCDPAFFLDAQEAPLPENFIPGNTVGINVSEMTITSENSHAYSNVIAVIRYILDKTDMSVCLIPHVYSIAENRNDYPILKKIASEINDRRISIVNKEYTCEELKYIISNCRFFIGARTHSTIAAYSSAIPTLVIGYSVKSKGIAIDLFGTYDGFVIPYNELTENNELLSAFKNIVKKEKVIKDHLIDFLPQYKKTLSENVKKYITDRIIDPPHKPICNKPLCSGCGSCAQKCPASAISMKPDEEGFLYPEIDVQKCTNCKICYKTCPVANKYKDTSKKPISYAAYHKNENIRNTSSSGGLFTFFSEKIISEDGIVFGAGYDENMRVIHKHCTTLDQLKDLRGSKYVQSEIGNTYELAESFLKQGKKVLFTGTPCQIGGLYSYLDDDYDNLYTIDFVCHGVPSPKIWQKYLSEKEADSKAISVNFRDKTEGWQAYSLKIDFANGAQYRQLSSKNMFLKGFVQNLYLRPSCSSCSFKQMGRKSDITLADFWGVENLLPDYYDKKGTSLLLIHSKKGACLLEDAPKINFQLVDFDKAIEKNRSYICSIKHSRLRSDFFKEVNKRTVEKNVNRFYGKSKTAKLRRIAAIILNK